MANRRFIDFPIAASVGDNDIVLIWQDGLNKQTTKSTLFAGSPSTLASLTDVDISALTNGQILQYNSTTSKWENVDRTDIDLDQLGDVTIVSPTNGQVLVYNSSTSKWENSSGGFVPYTGAVTTVNLGAQSILAGTFVKAGGTSAQFLKADGSVDSNTYLTTGSAAATYVPYTGATADVNLGTHDLTAERGTFQNNGSSDTLTVNHTSGSGYGIKVTKGGNNEALYVSKTSGSGNAMAVVGGRTALVDLSLSSVSNATGNFLTISGGVVHQRTPSETRSDVGAQAQLNGTGFVKASGTTITYDNSTYQVTSEKAQPNGYASLDGNGKVPLTQINDALIGNVNYQGLWNAATNTPTLVNPPSSGTKGYYYIVSTAGTFASISFEVGDWIISNGSAWQKVDNTDAVSSVFGRTGNVIAANGDYNTSQVTELTNLYYTEARVSANTDVAANTAARHNAVTLGTANGLSLSTQQLSLGLASAGVTGALSGTDWSTFNSKVSSQWITSGSNIYYNTGNVTIGGTSPTERLSVQGNTNLGNSIEGAAFTTRISGFAVNETESVRYGDYGFLIFNSNNGYTSSARRFVITNGLNANKFAIIRSVNATTDPSLGNAGSVASGTPDFVISSAGNVGINNPNPSVPLDVIGLASFSSSVTASSFIRNGGTSSQFLKADGSVDSNTYYLASNPSAFIALTALSGTAPIQYNNTTGAISITQASGSTNGFLSSTDWTTFNNKQAALNGTGFVKISGTTISYDNSTYLTTAAAASTYVPYTGATSGVDIGTYTLSASNLIANGGFNAGALLLKQSSNAQTIFLGYTAITPVGNNTLNFGFSTGSGVWKNFTLSSFLLTDNINRTYTLPDASGTIALVGGSGVGTVTSVAALTLGTSGTDLSSTVANSTTTPVITLNVPTASASNRGALSAADWTTFNNKQNALTNPVTGTGTTNYLPKFTGTSTIGNSAIFDNDGNILIGAESNAEGAKLKIAGGYVFLKETGGADVYFRSAFNTNQAAIQVASSNDLAFATSNVSRMVLTLSGNLTIGNNSVSAINERLNVTGNGILIESTDAGSSMLFGHFGGTDGIIGTFTNQNLQIRTNNSTRATLDTSGNLGLGVTPSAWGSLNTSLDFTYGSLYRFSDTSFGIAGNAFYNGSNWIYKLSQAASDYFLESGQHIWRTAPSGTAGNAISFTQAMTLTSSSKLLVNTTADSGNYFIQANGNIASINSSAGGLFTVSGTRSIAMQSFAGDWNYLRSNGQNLVFGTQDANTLYIRTSDVDRLTIASTGAATFSNTVRVNGGELTVYSGSSVMYTGVDTGNNYVYFGTNTANYGISFQASGDRMRIFNDGNVSINNTSNAGFKLDVNGTGRFSGRLLINSSTNYSALQNTNTSGNIYWGIDNSTGSDFTGVSYARFIYSEGAYPLITYVNGAERMRIASTGAATFSSSVTATAGIFNLNTTDGGFKIVGVNATPPNLAYLANNYFPKFYTRNHNFGITIFDQDSNNVGIQAADLVNGTSAKALIFNPYGGNVGIGTASPNYLLHIAAGAANPQLQFTSTGTGSTTSDGFHIGVNNSTLNAFLLQKENADLQILTNDTERMRITSGGNVLIGTTTDSGARLQVNGGDLRVQGNTNLGNSLGSTLSSTFTTRVSGFALRQDVSNRYGNYGVLIINSDSGWTSSARRFMITNGIGANKFGIIRSVDANTDPALGDGGSIASGTVDLEINNTGAATFSSSVTAGGTITASLNQGSNNQFFNLTGTQSGFAQTYSLGIIGSSKDLRIFDITANAERIRLSSVGDFTVNGAILTTGIYTSSTSEFATTVGQVRIGTTTPSSDKLRVAGSTYTDTIITQTPAATTKSVAWKLGTAATGTVNPNRLIRVEVDGVGYDLVARQII
jgi:hypothetical protein